MHNFTDLSHEEQDLILDEHAKHVHAEGKLELLEVLYKKSVEMIGLECNGGKEYTKACISFKGAVQKLMIFDEKA